MPLVVVGSVALDSVETPKETREDILGGSAVYFSVSASYFTPVHLVGLVGLGDARQVALPGGAGAFDDAFGDVVDFSFHAGGVFFWVDLGGLYQRQGASLVPAMAA